MQQHGEAVPAIPAVVKSPLARGSTGGRIHNPPAPSGTGASDANLPPDPSASIKHEIACVDGQARATEPVDGDGLVGVGDQGQGDVRRAVAGDGEIGDGIGDRRIHLELVHPVLKVGNGVLAEAGSGVDEDVGPRAAGHAVVAAAAIQRLAAGQARQSVAAVTTEQLVALGPAGQHVFAAEAGEDKEAGPTARHGVGGGARSEEFLDRRECVAGRRAGKNAGGEIQDGAGRRRSVVDGIGAAAAAVDVGAGAFDEAVVARTARKAVVEDIARADEIAGAGEVHR